MADTADYTDMEVGASAFSNVTIKKAAYERIQREIEALHAKARDWKTCHNRLSIVSRLSPELLAAVFTFVERGARDPSGKEAYSDTKLRWIQRVSHVCSQWRQVAIECSSLWCCIPLSHPTWTMAMLIRSRMNLLTLTTRLYTKSYKQLIALLERDTTVMSRIRKLCLIQGLDNVMSMNKILKLFSGAKITNLETLRLSFCYRYSIPDDLFSGGLPALRSFQLEGGDIKWSSPLLTNLRSFTLNNLPLQSTASATKLFSVLECLPELEYLAIISDNNFLEGEDKNHALPTIYLPQLKHLKVSLPLANSVLLMNHLTYHMDTTVDLKCTSSLNRHGRDGFLLQARSISKTLARGIEKPIRCVLIDPLEIKIKAWNLAGLHNYLSRPDADPPVMMFRLELDDNDDVVGDECRQQALSSMLNNFPLHDLESLHVYGAGVKESSWLSCFTDLKKLQTIRVIRSGSGLLQVLSKQPKQGHSDASESLEFPALQRLIVSGWDFEGRDIAGRTCYGMLRAWLEERKRSRSPLPELYIRVCSRIEPDDITALHQVVGKVDWDGSGSLSSEEEESDDNPVDLYIDPYDSDY